MNVKFVRDFSFCPGFQNSERGLLNIKPCDVCLLSRGHSPRYDYNFFSHREKFIDLTVGKEFRLKGSGMLIKKFELKS